MGAHLRDRVVDPTLFEESDDEIGRGTVAHLRADRFDEIGGRWMAEAKTPGVDRERAVHLRLAVDAGKGLEERRGPAVDERAVRVSGREAFCALGDSLVVSERARSGRLRLDVADREAEQIHSGPMTLPR